MLISAMLSWLRSMCSHGSMCQQEKWPAPFCNGRECFGEVDRLEGERILFHKFVQFLCHRQLVRVRAYADKHGVLLKGDLPILVGRDSADVWMFPEYFRMGYEAGMSLSLCLVPHLTLTVGSLSGAPPDMYAQDGQGWGFPPYNWDTLAADGYWWWRGASVCLPVTVDVSVRSIASLSRC
jgi:4-alpha-glucanotransferase